MDQGIQDKNGEMTIRKQEKLGKRVRYLEKWCLDEACKGKCLRKNARN